jgi:hypothetical protein
MGKFTYSSVEKVGSFGPTGAHEIVFRHQKV